MGKLHNRDERKVDKLTKDMEGGLEMELIRLMQMCINKGINIRIEPLHDFYFKFDSVENIITISKDAKLRHIEIVNSFMLSF